MENNSEQYVSNWAEARLAVLSPDSQWQPNTLRGLARLRAQHRAGSVHERKLILAAAATVACLGLMALPTPRVFAHRCLDCSVALWQSLSTKGFVGAANLIPERDRKIAPDFTRRDASGRPLKLSDFKGRVVLLNFWATWCGGCQVEVPWFVEFQKQYKNRGLGILGVSMDDDGWKAVKPYLEQKKVNYSIVIGNDDLRKLYGLDSMPMTLLIDRDGKIAASHVGLVSKSDYEAEIERLLSK